jgi:hypothetical protein
MDTLAPEWTTEGVTAGEIAVDPSAAYEKAKALWREEQAIQERRQRQAITYNRPVIALVMFGDLHLGGRGVDYERLEAHVDIVNDTPGMYPWTVGDLLDDFIIGKLMALRMDAPFVVTEEWALVRYVLDRLAPKLQLSVGGNHDGWPRLLTGIDYFREVLAKVSPNVLYHKHEIALDIRVPGWDVPTVVRHKWDGFSMWNPTHPVERAGQMARDFLLGVSAHTHRAGLARPFNARGKTGMAVLCGSYKRYDDYAEEKGYGPHNDLMAVPVLIDGESQAFGTFTSLEAAARWMRHIY